MYMECSFAEDIAAELASSSYGDCMHAAYRKLAEDGDLHRYAYHSLARCPTKAPSSSRSTLNLVRPTAKQT